MKCQPAKDCFVGEMVILDMDMFMLHCYSEVIGHEHEKGIVLLRNAHCDEDGEPVYKNAITKVPYEQSVRIRPEAPKAARKEFREQSNRYKFWPYDADVNFSLKKLDWRSGVPI